jgi:hypothetical protein
MGKLLAGIIIGGLGVYAYQHAHQPKPIPNAQSATPEALPAVEREEPKYRCDGRTHCSQMTSCEEATFFLQNCASVEMDGDGDGVPCEKQWCGRL